MWLGQVRHLGFFDDEVDAAKAYDRAVVELKGSSAQTNFPVAGGGGARPLAGSGSPASPAAPLGPSAAWSLSGEGPLSPPRVRGSPGSKCAPPPPLFLVPLPPASGYPGFPLFCPPPLFFVGRGGGPFARAPQFLLHLACCSLSLFWVCLCFALLCLHCVARLRSFASSCMNKIDSRTTEACSASCPMQRGFRPSFLTRPDDMLWVICQSPSQFDVTRGVTA